MESIRELLERRAHDDRDGLFCLFAGLCCWDLERSGYRPRRTPRY